MTAASHTLQTDQECKDVTGFSADELYSSSVISAVTCESNSYRCNGSCNAPVSSTSLKMSLIYGVLLSNDAVSAQGVTLDEMEDVTAHSLDRGTNSAVTQK